MNKEKRRESLTSSRSKIAIYKKLSNKPLTVRTQEEDNAQIPAERMIKINNSTKSSMFQITSENISGLRNIPDELQGKVSIVGNEKNMLSLYQYTKKIARTFFSLQFYKKIFPDHFKGPIDNSKLSFISKNSFTSTKSSKSHIPKFNQKRKDYVVDPLDEVPPSEIDFKPAFKLLEKGLVENKKNMRYLTDFCLLYPSLILSVNLDAACAALEFLNKFLDLKSTRKNESNVLFSVLIGIREKIQNNEGYISVLSKLATLEESIQERLKNGTTRKTLAPLCIKVLNFAGIDYQNSDDGSYQDIESSETSVLEILSGYIESLESGEQPLDLTDFLLCIANAMQEYEKSAKVLELAAQCAESTFKCYREPSLEVLHKFMLICSKILSEDFFLEGESSFDAIEAVETLYSTIFKSISVEYLKRAVTSVIAEANGTQLDVIILKLEEVYVNEPTQFDESFYKYVIDMLMIFHPEYVLPECFMVFTKNQIQKYQDSIERLSNPDTISDEVKTIVGLSEDGDFSNYPNKYITMLRTTWILKNCKQPVNCSTWLYERTIKLRSLLQ